MAYAFRRGPDVVVLDPYGEATVTNVDGRLYRVQVEQDVRDPRIYRPRGAHAEERLVSRASYAPRCDYSRVASGRAKTFIESDYARIHAVTERPDAAFPSVFYSRAPSQILQIKCDDIASGEIARPDCGQQPAKIRISHCGAELSNRKRRIQEYLDCQEREGRSHARTLKD